MFDQSLVSQSVSLCSSQTVAPSAVAQPGSAPLVELEYSVVASATLESNQAVFQAIRDGSHDVNAVWVGFETLVRDAAQLRLQLTKTKTVKDLERLASPRWRGEKKAVLVEQVYTELLYQYGWLTVPFGGMLSTFGFTEEDIVRGLRQKLRTLTVAQLDAYRQRYADTVAQMRTRIETRSKALLGPSTIEEFATFIAVKGEDSLTPEQRLRRDELVADSINAKAQARQQAKALVAGAAVSIGVKLIETLHTRDHYPLFVVQLESRVSAEEYSTLNIAARRLGGWYSSYSKDGAVPGFPVQRATCRSELPVSLRRQIGGHRCAGPRP